MARAPQKSRHARQSFCRSLFARSLRCEQLEDRRLLAVITVDTDQDVVDLTDGVTSLREAIFAANIVPGADEIVFDFGHDDPATILLEQGELVITDSLTITGPGAELLTIDAQQQSRIFSITSAAGICTISGITLVNGHTTGNQSGSGGAIRSDSMSTLTLNDVHVIGNSTTGFFATGGGVFSRGHLILDDSKVSGNSVSTTQSTGGGIRTVGDLTLRDSEVSGNTGLTGGIFANGNVEIFGSMVTDNVGTGAGGGIYVLGDISVDQSLISRNTAIEGGGIVAGRQGGSSVSIHRSTISDNISQSFGGGGIVFTGTVTLTQTTVSGNESAGDGAGILSNGTSYLMVDESIISNNFASGAGGGISVRFGTALISNSTISGNSAGTSGGGIAGSSSRQGITLIQSTVSGNSAGMSGGGIWSPTGIQLRHTTVTLNNAEVSGGGLHFQGRSLGLEHSIIADNTAPVGRDLTVPFATVVPVLINAHYSLIGTNAGTTLPEAPVGSPDANGNLIGGPVHGVIDPLLAPLADNGGPTLTHALLPGSPAINAGDPALVAGVGDTPEFDQRGEPFARVFGGRIDIGAYERQSFVVDTLVDEMDGNYGHGDLSLREALSLANSRPGHDTIEFSSELFEAGPATIHLSLIGGQIPEFGPTALLIQDDLTILAPGADLLTIDAIGLDATPGVPDWGGARVLGITDFNDETKIDVHIEGLTLTRGDTYWGGSGIMSFEDLSLSEVHVVDNFARGFGGGLWIYEGTANVEKSLLSGNATLGRGGAIATGFFLHDRPASLTISNSTIAANQAVYEGGGIYAQGSELTVRNCTITNNSMAEGAIISAEGLGGGIHSENSATRVFDSLIQDNRARGGAGISVERGSVEVRNSTVSDNTAENNSGGLFAYTGDLKVYNSTIAFNHSLLEDAEGVGVRVIFATSTVENSIVWGNSDAGSHSYDLYGVDEINYSLIGQLSPFHPPLNPSNLVGVDPLLGPLADNGGPTLTYALLAGSPAINAGEPIVATGFPVTPFFDQRGEPFVRVSRGRIDIGAFESQLPEGNTFVVDTLADENDGDFSAGDFSLREAIALANQLPGAQTIEFDPSLAGGTILLEHGELVISDTLDVNGLGAELLTIDAQQRSRVILVDGRTTASPRAIDVSFNGIRFTGGLAPNAVSTPFQLRRRGGGILFYSTGILTANDCVITGNAATNSGPSAPREGGGIYSFGNVSLVDSSVSNNVGSGVEVMRAGATVLWSQILDNDGLGILAVQFEAQPVTVTESFVSGNQRGGILAWWGPVTVVDSVVSNNGTPTGNSSSGIATGLDLTVIRSTVSGNFAYGGGGLWSGNNITVTDSSIINNHDVSNSSRYGGGGIFQRKSFLTQIQSMTITNSVISGNTSQSHGGGIFAAGNTSLLNSVISGNHANGLGGGIFGYSNGIFGDLDVRIAVESSSIDANTARGYRQSGAGIFSYGDVSVRNSTVSNNNRDFMNQATFGGIVGRNIVLEQSTISGNGRGGVFTQGGTITASHSTITNNTGSGLNARNVNLSHTIVAGNIFTNQYERDVSFNSLTATYSLISAGAEYLAPLADNGGPTLTHALLPGSPAINAGEPTLVGGQNGVPEQDQRGGAFARIVGGRIDIGAFELQPAAGTYDGDFDGDGDVDGRDFLRWQRNYGATGSHVTKALGDATGNQVVDGNDLDVWQGTYGNELSALSGQLLESQEQSAESQEPEISGSRLWSLDSRLPTSLAVSRRETATTDDAVFDDPYLEQVDRAFDNWRPVERNRCDFGDIVTRRTVKFSRTAEDPSL